MARFQPSVYDPTYGGPLDILLSPIRAGKAASEAVVSWFADDAMVGLAQRRINIGPEIYTQLEPRMTKTPMSLPVAQEQAAYFIAIASRRAGALGMSGAQDYLLNQLQFVLNAAEATDQDVGWTCSMAGVGCPIAGGASTLAKAAKAIEDAQLPQEETVRMTTILYANRRGALLRQAIPWVVGIGSITAIGYYFYSQRGT